MAWVLILMSIFPIFKLDRITRRDIRKYNRTIKKYERYEKSIQTNMLQYDSIRRELQ